jgi:hypothetical protein
VAPLIPVVSPINLRFKKCLQPKLEVLIQVVTTLSHACLSRAKDEDERWASKKVTSSGACPIDVPHFSCDGGVCGFG